MKKLLVGLHCFGHDSNMSIFDMSTQKTKYFKWERNTGIKHYASGNLVEWCVHILPVLGYEEKDVLEVCVSRPVIAPWMSKKTDDEIIKISLSNFDNVCVLNHHLAHLYSSSCENGLVYDASGNDGECLSIYGKNRTSLKFTNNDHFSMGLVYNDAFDKTNSHRSSVFKDGFDEMFAIQVDFAGKVMAWEAYGDYLPGWHKENKDKTLLDCFDWLDSDKMNLDNCRDKFHRHATFVKNITLKYTDEIIKLLKNFYMPTDKFSFTGGVAQNLIMNNFLKHNFPNIELLPHNSDDGQSIGCLRYLMKKHKVLDYFKLDNFPFCQSDEDMGYASHSTIKQTAEHLANGKIVLWCQGNGEIGPRALGHRSVLMNPLIKDAKEQINNKVKKREWYRPYAASVKVDNYKDYFDLDWESPYMLYQANVKNKEQMPSICHADGTCRIQTVYSKQETYYSLLNEFEKITGIPILLNTSCNVPGKPIVGFTNQAKEMLSKSKADYLVIGNEIIKNN